MIESAPSADTGVQTRGSDPVPSTKESQGIFCSSVVCWAEGWKNEKYVKFLAVVFFGWGGVWGRVIFQLNIVDYLLHSSPIIDSEKGRKLMPRRDAILLVDH